LKVDLYELSADEHDMKTWRQGPEDQPRIETAALLSMVRKQLWHNRTKHMLSFVPRKLIQKEKILQWKIRMESMLRVVMRSFRERSLS
jgi:hypothetical protein